MSLISIGKTCVAILILDADGIQSAWATQTLYIVDTELVPNQRYDFQIRTLTQTIGEESDFAHGYAMTHIGAPDKPDVTATADGEDCDQARVGCVR